MIQVTPQMRVLVAIEPGFVDHASRYAYADHA